MKNLLKITGILFITHLMFQTCLAQKNGSSAAEALVNYCIENHNKKIGRGQCTDLVFYALSDLNKSLHKDSRTVNYNMEELQAGDIVHLQWKKGFKQLQHYMIIIEVINGTEIKIAHQNVNNQLKVVYTTQDLLYEQTVRKRDITVYRLS